MIPVLDLHGVRHHEVQYVVARVIEDWIGNGLFLDVITGNSMQMFIEASSVIEQYGLEYYTGLSDHPGRIRIVMYDDFH